MPSVTVRLRGLMLIPGLAVAVSFSALLGVL
jgi:hypothetical protein